MIKSATVLMMLASVLLISCKEGNEKKISSYYDTESHNTGMNCMQCHNSDGGSGEGWFTVAGSVYDTSLVSIYPNTTINLYTGANGTGDLVKMVEVDGKANFYTTKKVDFTDGLYPSVTGTDGVVKHMSFAVTTGECNSCHGSSTSEIWAE